MGWKGTLRSINSVIKWIEKENQRKLALQVKLKAQNDAKEYDERINEIKSIHIDCCPPINWNSIISQEAPVKPENLKENEKEARTKYNKFKPSFLYRLFMIENWAKKKLYKNIKKALALDNKIYYESLAHYKKSFDQWKEDQYLAKKIIDNNVDVDILQKIIESKTTMLKSEFCDDFRWCVVNNSTMLAEISVFGYDIIPDTMPVLTRAENISIKYISKSSRHKIYQDYVCSAVLRVARELFSVTLFDEIIVNAVDNLVNSATGKLEEVTILSVLFNRKKFSDINFERIDPPNSVRNFRCNMDFKRYEGFKPVNNIKV